MFLWNSYRLNEAYIKEGKCKICKVNVNSKHNIKMNETKSFRLSNGKFVTWNCTGTSYFQINIHNHWVATRTVLIWIFTFLHKVTNTDKYFWFKWKQNSFQTQCYSCANQNSYNDHKKQIQLIMPKNCS